MAAWPKLDALDDALAQVVIEALADDLPVAEESVYFGAADDPRAPLPSCRIFRGALVGKGTGGGSRRGIPQAQVWSLTILAIAEGDYTASVLGTDYTYTAGPGDDAAAIQAGLLAALAPCPDALASALGEDAVQLVAVELGKHLAVTSSANLGRAVTTDRHRLETSQLGELTISFQFAALLDPSSPSGSQHALARASLLRSALWHPSSLATLRGAGLAPLRVLSGPLPADERLDTVTETRATLEVVFSVRLGATSRPPLIETADHEGAVAP